MIEKLVSGKDTTEFWKQAERKQQKEQRLSKDLESLDYQINCTKNCNNYLNTTSQTKISIYLMESQGGNDTSNTSCYSIPELLITKVTRTRILQSLPIRVTWKNRI